MAPKYPEKGVKMLFSFKKNAPKHSAIKKNAFFTQLLGGIYGKQIWHKYLCIVE